MKNLIKIIGKAPSEIPLEDLLSRLETNRRRTRKAIEAHRLASLPKVRSSAKKELASFNKLVKESGITEEEFRKLIAETLERKKKNAKPGL